LKVNPSESAPLDFSRRPRKHRLCQIHANQPCVAPHVAGRFKQDNLRASGDIKDVLVPSHVCKLNELPGEVAEKRRPHGVVRRRRLGEDCNCARSPCGHRTKSRSRLRPERRPLAPRIRLRQGPRAPAPPGAPSQVIGGSRVLPTIELARQVGAHTYASGSRLYVATPALLRHLGINAATIDPSTDFLADPTVPTDELIILGVRKTRAPGTRKATISKFAVTNVQRIDSRELLGSPMRETGLKPSSFITLDGLRRHGWKQIPSGWLLESSRPLTSEQIAAARGLAANAGLTIEARRASTSLAKPIAIATAAGALLALAILAMTVGLIRSETAGDLRTLTATGATSRIRRTLTAATAGALALLGALLGLAGAYLALAATYLNDLGYLSRVPVLYLILTVVGVPLAATAAGWLLAGREPPAIARPVIE
jgi:hypothetical protein